MKSNIKDELKNKLTLEDCRKLVEYFDGDPTQIKDNYFIAKTICHNGVGEGSHKLYCYDNGNEGQLFHCYTKCEESSFDIFELVSKVENINLYQSILFVNSFFNNLVNLEDYQEQEQLDDWNYLGARSSSNETKKQLVALRTFEDKIIKNLPKPIIQPWLDEGITKETMDAFYIRYNPSNHSVVIPHYDRDGNLIGIRERTLIKENEKFGKYKPAIFNGKQYNHPLSYNLYGLDKAKNGISVGRRAVVFEAEKSVNLAFSYFSAENFFFVASCGSSISEYQIKLLRDCGAEEIIIAFDKQWKELNDPEHLRWVKKLKSIYSKFNKYVTISFIFDLNGLLDYKDSPIDKGKDIFIKLYKERILLS